MPSELGDHIKPRKERAAREVIVERSASARRVKGEVVIFERRFTGRHNMRPLDTLDQMALMGASMDGKPLRYRDLVG